MSLYSMLESTGTLKRPTIGRDAKQGVTQDPFVVLVRGEPCSVQPASTNIQVLYAQRNQVANTQIYFERDIGAEPNDIFEATDANDVTHTFLVRGFAPRLFNRFQAPYVLDCEEIQ